jgi:outer membrane biosynthesis protein TonB
MSAWTDFVKNYAKSKGISYSAALKKAAPAYRRSKSAKKMVKDKGKKEDLDEKKKNFFKGAKKSGKKSKKKVKPKKKEEPKKEYKPKKKDTKALSKMLKKKKEVQKASVSKLKRKQRNLTKKDKFVKRKERKKGLTGCSLAAQTLRLAPCSNRSSKSQAPKCKAAGAVLRGCRKKKK